MIQRASLSLILSLAASSISIPTTAQPLEVTSVVLGGTLRTERIPLELDLACATSPPPSAGEELHGTSEGNSSCRMIRFRLRIGQKTVEIPPEAFSDLANPSLLGGLSVLEVHEELVISLVGGDGEASYAASFIVVGGELLRRELSEVNADGERTTTNSKYAP